MTFVKHIENGMITIPFAALILSSLESEDKLEMHTLDRVIILFKDNMHPHEKLTVVNELTKLTNSLVSEMATQWDISPEPENSISIPMEALEDAGIDNGDLRVLADDGIVILIRDNQKAGLSPSTIDELAEYGVSPEQLSVLLAEDAADDQ